MLVCVLLEGAESGLEEAVLVSLASTTVFLWHEDLSIWPLPTHIQWEGGDAPSLPSPLCDIKGEKGEWKYFIFLLFLLPQHGAQLPLLHSSLTRKFPHVLCSAHAGAFSFTGLCTLCTFVPLYLCTLIHF